MGRGWRELRLHWFSYFYLSAVLHGCTHGIMIINFCAIVTLTVVRLWQIHIASKWRQAFILQSTLTKKPFGPRKSESKLSDKRSEVVPELNKKPEKKNTWYCDCRSGFILENDVCEDVNECKDGHHNCDSTNGTVCVNSVGSFQARIMNRFE